MTNVQEILIFNLPLQPNPDNGDDEHVFDISNYYEGISMTIYNRLRLVIDGVDKVFDVEEDYEDIGRHLFEKLDDTFLLKGTKPTPDLMLGLLYSVLYHEQDSSITESFGDNALITAEGSSNAYISSEYAGMQGIRSWSLDIDDLTINVGDTSIEIDYSESEYEDISEYFFEEEDNVEIYTLVI